jgi:hypothetical protein
MKTLIATLALASIVALAVANAEAAQLKPDYPCPRYNHAAQTCGLQKQPDVSPNNEYDHPQAADGSALC